MYEISPESVIPQFHEFDTHFQHYEKVEICLPIKAQQRLRNSLDRLINDSSRSNVLLVNAKDSHTYFQLLKNQIISEFSIPKAYINCAEQFDHLDLFGAAYRSKSSTELQFKNGILRDTNNGILILSLSQLLNIPDGIAKLKNVIARQMLPWQSAKPDCFIEIPEPTPLNIRIIIIGDRALNATLEMMEPDFLSFCLYGEYEPELNLNVNNIDTYLGIVKYFEQSILKQTLSHQALKRVMQAGVRFTEDQKHLPLCPIWFESLFHDVAFSHESANEEIQEKTVISAIENKYFRESYLPLRALDDIHFGQIFIDTQGEHIGQVNGLTVVEIPGHPLPYGEPARISCVVHSGDGDISDVERKVELGGNIHAKGMMIMQAFVTSALNLNHPLPLSASIVFEQSYCEVDGDSASLAELCAFISALAQHPINQEVAMTGSVDQFGRVQAVSGINEKIEGFYYICAHRGLTGNQGVIIPKSNLQSLCLNQETAMAIENKQFHIWAVENVEEVFPLVAGLPFENKSEEENDSLLSKIAERTEAILNGDSDHISLFQRLKSWLNLD